MLTSALNWFCFQLLPLNPEDQLSKALHFFLYDSIKILGILFIMIFIIGFIRSYISPQKIKQLLSGSNKIIGHFAASIFGAITPFCSCSGIPIFLSFIKAGTPLGVALSFFITSPIINEYLVILMLSFFGVKITIVYLVNGILLGTFLGMFLGSRNLDSDILFNDTTILDSKEENSFNSLASRFKFGWKEAIDITKKLWIWVLIGVGIGALIHNYVPEDFIHSLINKGGIFTVPIATFFGVPLYGSCVAIVPIAVVLFQKGVPLGTALAFMMATSALSLPEAVILRSSMKLRLILIFFATVTAAIIFTGFLLNFLQPILV